MPIKISRPETPARSIDFTTPHGPARAQLYSVRRPRAALALGHGAAGGVQTPDLLAARDAGRSLDISVALIEQPYRVAGRRSPAPARQLDAAWLAVLERLREDPFVGLPLVVGGRSAGARVACRTAAQARACAVLCLAFPVHPPGRPDKSRLDELDAVTLPTLVVQGERDPFGIPPQAPGRIVLRVPGNHSLRDGAAVGTAVSDWLSDLLGPLGRLD